VKEKIEFSRVQGKLSGPKRFAARESLEHDMAGTYRFIPNGVQESEVKDGMMG
jgi:hypothetical protein